MPEIPHASKVQDVENLASQINGRLGGWAAAMHLQFLYTTGDQVTAELEVGPVHLQAYGIVHGGVYAGMIESVASVGAALWARRYNQNRGRTGEPDVIPCGYARRQAHGHCPAIDARSSHTGLAGEGHERKRPDSGRGQGEAHQPGPGRGHCG
jgi:hypothetical protein